MEACNSSSVTRLLWVFLNSFHTIDQLEENTTLERLLPWKCVSAGAFCSLFCTARFASFLSNQRPSRKLCSDADPVAGESRPLHELGVCLMDIRKGGCSDEGHVGTSGLSSETSD